MTSEETKDQRSKRILNQLRVKYPGKKAFDLDDQGKHFACEIEPTEEHPEYDRAIEVIISSKPHKHLKTKQHYKIISGSLQLHIEDKVLTLQQGDEYTIEPNKIHWAESDNECWVEIYSEPGWTKKDHIPVNYPDN